jgi:YD repeat-containing protein
MQEAQITDPDGITRQYAFDGARQYLAVRDQQSERRNPGRPYRPVFQSGSNAAFTLQAAHAEMWQDHKRAAECLASDWPQITWMSAYGA